MSRQGGRGPEDRSLETAIADVGIEGILREEASSPETVPGSVVLPCGGPAASCGPVPVVETSRQRRILPTWMVADLPGWFASLLVPAICPHCGRAARAALLCPACRSEALQVRHETATPPRGFSTIFAGPVLSGPTRTLVHALKYEGQKRFAEALVELACADGIPPLPAGGVLVPVPVHRTRRRERGYNQSEELARAYAARAGLPILTKALVRVRSTGTQTRLGAEERWRNIGEAIRVGPEFRPGMRAIIVDDVVTTGATLTACAATLLGAGASEVHGLVALLAPQA